MSRLQNWLARLLPLALMRAIETESRSWQFQCPCGRATSVWDLGGLRWKARGTPTRWLKCPHCGQAGWHRLTTHPTTHRAP